MSPEQISKIEELQRRLIEGNKQLLDLLPKLKPADQLVYADRVKQTIINSQTAFNGTNQLSGLAARA